MNELSNTPSNHLINLLHSGGKGMTLPIPFERDIFLFDTQVAGTSHVEGIAEIVTTLEIGKKLLFFREPDNDYDKHAIKIKTTQGAKIGYVPQNDNLIFSRLMDAGKNLFGKVTAIKEKGNWYQIKIDIFLKE